MLLLLLAVLAAGSVAAGPRIEFSDPDFVYLGPGLNLFRNSERAEFLQHRLAAGEDAEARLLQIQVVEGLAPGRTYRVVEAP